MKEGRNEIHRMALAQLTGHPLEYGIANRGRHRAGRGRIMGTGFDSWQL